MKVIPALMAMAVSAMAATSDPGETAVHFLEKVRAKALDLEPGADTALAPSTSSAKRKEIARRLERMARDLGNDPLEVGAVKLDGDLAGVLVRKISGFDPNRMQVFPIALVKRGGQWAPAPVPASFENSGVGYAAAVRQRLASLQDWMLRQQVLDLANLRDQSAEHMRRKIEQSLPAVTLRSLNPRQTAERFLAACETRNLPEIFGLLGGLSKSLPDNWPQRVKAAERAVAAASDVSSPWRPLVSKEVLHAIAHDDEDGQGALVSIGYVDPAASRPDVRFIHFELTQSNDGLWRINLPDALLQESGALDEVADDDLDSDLIGAFIANLAKAQPKQAPPDTDRICHALSQALQTGGLPSLIQLVRFTGTANDDRKICQRAARFWKDLNELSPVHATLLLALKQDEKKAAAVFQCFSARNPERTNLRILYFQRFFDGWFWNPDPSGETATHFKEWASLQTEKWNDQWQKALLADCPALKMIPEAGAPSEEASRTLAESWLRAVRNGDVASALGLTARLNLPDSKAILLRNLGFELIGARKMKRIPNIVGVHHAAGWSAVSIQMDSDGHPSFPLYPVISTPSGPRILAEIDLSASGQRSRDFLNKMTFERLETIHPEASRALKKLFADHQSAVSTLQNP